MSQIPFHLSNEIALAMGMDKRFYRKCFYALISGNGLGVVLGGLARNGTKVSFSWDSAAVVLGI